MHKLPRTIRLDASDTFVFTRAAEPGEWAVGGGFVFIGADPQALDAKARIAWRSGFLGINSLGWSTLVVVSEASSDERAEAVESLASKLVADFGAPDLAVARQAAEEEITFAEQLCEHPVGTLIAVQRSSDDGETRERFRTLHGKEPEIGGDGLHGQARAFTFHEVEGEDTIEEKADLMGMLKAGRT